MMTTRDITIETEQSNKDFLAEMLEAGRKVADEPVLELAKSESKSEPETGSLSAFLKEMLEAGKKVGDKPIRPEHDKPDTKKWTDEQKKEACPRNNGQGYSRRGVKKANIRKLWNGDTQILPRYCNMCEGCYRHHAKELKERMEYIDALAKHRSKDNGGGHWRKAVVEDDKAKTLKKKVSRNQESRHVEFAADKPGHNEVWTYVDNDEPEPEKYGELGNPEQDIDFDEVYKNNRKTGKKFSVGKAFRSSTSATKEDTIRIVIPEVVVDMADADKAEKIMRETNYIKEAETAREAQEAYAHEFKHIIAELEKEGIEILAVDNSYLNVDPNRLLEEWNRSRKYWMSINATLLPKENEGNMDIRNRLYYPDNKKEPQEEALS